MKNAFSVVLITLGAVSVFFSCTAISTLVVYSGAAFIYLFMALAERNEKNP